MKVGYILVAVAAFFPLVCSAQLKAPIQTDTLVITGVRYDHMDIDRSNWPCTEIYRTPVSFWILGEERKISSSMAYGVDVRYTLSDGTILTLTHGDDTFTISIDKYVFDCHRQDKPGISGDGGSKSVPPMSEGTPNAHLKGRNVVGNLPRPTYGVQAEGIVVVAIWVDNYGKVTKAQAGAEGTTVTDKTLWNAARNAAMGAHFNTSADAPALQEGTITYIFNRR